MRRFLDMHMYVTSVLQRTDMKAVALQMALDIMHEKEQRDLVTGLKSRMLAGRPNWNKVQTRAVNDPSVFTITEKASTMTFSWLKVLMCYVLYLLGTPTQGS